MRDARVRLHPRIHKRSGGNSSVERERNNSMDRKLSITKATENCSCNSCHAKNYDSGDRFDQKVDMILDVKIGNFCNRICPDCLKVLFEEAKNAVRV